MKAIIVSGTPGSGKTTLAKEVAKTFNYQYIDVNKIIKKNDLAESFDKDMDCFVIDTKNLNKALIEIITSSSRPLVIDSHMSHYLPKEYVDICLITKASPEVLRERLSSRNYSDEKIKENVDVEIFDICKNEAEEMGHKVVVVETTDGISFDELKRLF